MLKGGNSNREPALLDSNTVTSLDRMVGFISGAADVVVAAVVVVVVVVVESSGVMRKENSVFGVTLGRGLKRGACVGGTVGISVVGGNAGWPKVWKPGEAMGLNWPN